MQPLDLTLELARADSPGDPHAFSWGTRSYQRLRPGRVPQVAELHFDGDLAEDLAAVAATRPDPIARARLGQALRTLLDGLGFAEDEQQLQRASATAPVVLTLRLAAAELFALPWELVPVGTARLGQLPGVQLRYAWPDPTAPPEVPAEGGRLLLVSSAAGGPVPARAHREAIARSMASAELPFDSDTDVLEHATYTRLAERLATARRGRQPYTALHLLAHGGPLPGDAFGLLLGNEDGGIEGIDGGTLGELLALEAPEIRLVVLAACRSADPGAMANQLGSVAQRLHRHGVEAVLASRWPLSVDGSITLTRTLYQGLLDLHAGRGKQDPPLSLEAALGRARSALLRSEHPADATGLQLYVRGTPGELRPFTLRPYRGLLPFSPRHARFFFGRGPELDELLGEHDELVRLGEPRLQVVEGASGSGKSSLVGAGLIPELCRRDGDTRWVRMVPGARPLAALEEALGTLDGPGLLFVDQLEEVFTLVADDADGRDRRDRFLRRLWALAREGEVHIVTTLRSDFRGEAGTVALSDELRLDALFGSHMARHHVFVPRMPPAQLRQAIEQPARAVGLHVPPELTGRILAEVGDEPGALALVEFLLDRIWQRRTTDALPAAAYEEMGGVAQALAERADDVIAQLAAPELALVRRVLPQLVALGRDGAPDSRRRVPLTQLRERCAAEQLPLLEPVLSRLIAERLLVRAEGIGGTTIEVAHEALIRSWPTLQSWVEEDRSHRAALDRLQDWVDQWQEFGDTALLRGGRLEEAERLAGELDALLSPSMEELLQHSREAAAPVVEELPPTDDALALLAGALASVPLALCMAAPGLLVFSAKLDPDWPVALPAGVVWASLALGVATVLVLGRMVGRRAHGDAAIAGGAAGAIAASLAAGMGSVFTTGLATVQPVLRALQDGGPGSVDVLLSSMINGAATQLGGPALAVVLAGGLGWLGAGGSGRSPRKTLPHASIRASAGLGVLIWALGGALMLAAISVLLPTVAGTTTDMPGLQVATVILGLLTAGPIVLGTLISLWQLQKAHHLLLRSGRRSWLRPLAWGIATLLLGAGLLSPWAAAPALIMMAGLWGFEQMGAGHGPPLPEPQPRTAATLLAGCIAIAVHGAWAATFVGLGLMIYKGTMTAIPALEGAVTGMPPAEMTAVAWQTGMFTAALVVTSFLWALTLTWLEDFFPCKPHIVRAPRSIQAAGLVSLLALVLLAVQAGRMRPDGGVPEGLDEVWFETQAARFAPAERRLTKLARDEPHRAELLLHRLLLRALTTASVNRRSASGGKPRRLLEPQASVLAEDAALLAPDDPLTSVVLGWTADDPAPLRAMASAAPTPLLTLALWSWPEASGPLDAPALDALAAVAEPPLLDAIVALHLRTLGMPARLAADYQRTLDGDPERVVLDAQLRERGGNPVAAAQLLDAALTPYRSRTDVRSQRLALAIRTGDKLTERALMRELFEVDLDRRNHPWSARVVVGAALASVGRLSDAEALLAREPRRPGLLQRAQVVASWGRIPALSPMGQVMRDRVEWATLLEDHGLGVPTELRHWETPARLCLALAPADRLQDPEGVCDPTTLDRALLAAAHASTWLSAPRGTDHREALLQLWPDPDRTLPIVVDLERSGLQPWDLPPNW